MGPDCNSAVSALEQGKAQIFPPQVCRCQWEVSWEKKQAGINTAEASQAGSVQPLDPSLLCGALGWPLARAKLLAGLWTGLGSLQMGVLGEGHPLHTDGELQIPTSGAQGSAGTLPECLGAGSGNLKVLCQKVQLFRYESNDITHKNNLKIA